MPLNWALNYGNGSAFSFGDNKFQAAKLTMPNLADTLARFVEVVTISALNSNLKISRP